MLKLKLQIEELPQWKRPRCWERLKTGGEGEQKRRWLDGITDYDEFEFEQTPGDNRGQWTVRRMEDRLGYCSPWGCKELHRLSDLTTTKIKTQTYKVQLQHSKK